jgi:biopolymer transport protein ExbB
LLGTVAGMIEAFGVIGSNGGYATVTELSGGIYKSLLTTAAGLVVATPTFVAYSYLSSRVNTLMHDMERAGIEIVQMLTETEPESGIISFQPTAEAGQRDLRREK